MRIFVINVFTILLLISSIANAQTGLKGSGDIGHLQKKVSNYDQTTMGNISAHIKGGITKEALAAAMYEEAVLKNGEKYLPPISEVNYGCVGGGMGRGVEYLVNLLNETPVLEVDDDNPSLGQEVTDRILGDLRNRKLFGSGGTTGTPYDWKESKDKVTDKLNRKIGKKVNTQVFDFPKESGKVTGSSSSGSTYSQPNNIQEAVDMMGKAMKTGHAVELRVNNGFGCGGGFHFAAAYRIIRFKGFPDLFGITIVDDGKPDASSGQGNGKKENYERGSYIFNKNGNCLNKKGFKITHIVIETLEDPTPQRGR